MVSGLIIAVQDPRGLSVISGGNPHHTKSSVGSSGSWTQSHLSGLFLDWGGISYTNSPKFILDCCVDLPKIHFGLQSFDLRSETTSWRTARLLADISSDIHIPGRGNIALVGASAFIVAARPHSQ